MLNAKSALIISPKKRISFNIFTTRYLNESRANQFGDDVPAGDAPLDAHLVGLVGPEGGLVPRVAPLDAVALVVHVYVQVSVLVQRHCESR